MAVTKKEEARTPASAAPRTTEPKKTLGFLNINIATASGNPIRVEAIRLLEGNKTHTQLAEFLGMQREGDEKFTGDELVAEKARRLAQVVAQLDITFNPTRTDEESKLNLF